METVLIAIPAASNTIHADMAQQVYCNASRNYKVSVIRMTSSLLANNCNRLWCYGVNLRKQHNFKWFSMLHTDVVPEPFWIDKMIATASEYGADLLSAVIPIKNPTGITSTAVQLGNEFPYDTLRLTLRQLWDPHFPGTFDLSALRQAMPRLAQENQVDLSRAVNLLVNTGCMICRIDQEWANRIYFTINDLVWMNGAELEAYVEPEDWFFSRQVALRGGKVMATKEISVQHAGEGRYLSESIFGVHVDSDTSKFSKSL